jgi:hypothetical protein
MLEQKVRPHPEVVDTKLDDGEIVLLHLESKMYYSLNVAGERIWQGLKDGMSLEEISTRLQDEFDVDQQTADSSIVELVNELCQARLAEID